MTERFEAIGTTWTIDIYQELSPESFQKIIILVRNRIELFESTYSRFRKDSWLNKISSHPNRYDLPFDTEPMMTAYLTLYQLTNGCVTPLIGQILSNAGYDADYSLEPKKLVHPASWDEALDYQPPHITTKQKIKLDFGAIGKGYLVDIVGNLLEVQGIENYCVDAGGDMRHRNKKDLVVGLEDPDDASKVIGAYKMRNKSIAGSSGNRRSWKTYNHIINPLTLMSPRDVRAIWIIADTTLIADALTTALYFTDPEVLRGHYSFEYLIIHSDRSVTGTLLEDSNLMLY
jgi:thiamine biosynthesis lipoprotein